MLGEGKQIGRSGKCRLVWFQGRMVDVGGQRAGSPCGSGVDPSSTAAGVRQGLSTGDGLKVVNRSVEAATPFLYISPELLKLDFNHLHIFQFNKNEMAF